MRLLRAWVLRVVSILRSDRQESELANELEAHLALHIDDNVRAGMNLREARRAANIGLGGIESLKERCRDVGRTRWVEDLWQDVRYGLRKLRGSPGFTLVAILTLGLGIGANTALVGFLHLMLVQTLPVRAPDELVAFRWIGPNTVTYGLSNWGAVIAPEGEQSGASFPLLAVERFEDVNQTLTHVFASVPGQAVNLIADGTADAASSQFVTGQYYGGLGVAPSIGRLLRPDDDRLVDLPVVLSHAYWDRRFGQDEGIVGRAVTINGLPATVIGVEPEGLDSTLRVGWSSPDLTIPVGIAERLETGPLSSHPNYWRMLVMGRLKPGTYAEQARANFEPAFRQAALEADAATARTQEQLERRGSAEVPRLVLTSGSRGIYDVTRADSRPLMLLAAVFGIVLLIVCVNLANAMLSRTEHRRSEVGVRLAIGASRARVMRQLITESIVLAIMGGATGLIVAYLAGDLLATLSPRDLESEFGVMTAVFAGIIATSAGLLCGFVPALRATRVGHHVGYGSGDRVSISGWSLGRVLVVVQVALSLVLLVGAGLFLQTLVSLQTVQTGFNSANLVLFTIDPRFGQFEPEQARRIYGRLLQQLEAIPGVRSASHSSQTLLSGTYHKTSISVKGSESASGISPMWIHHGFFNTMEMLLVLGRSFSAADTADSPPVAVINETTARELFQDTNPIGQQVRRAGMDVLVEIIGVVTNVKYESVRNDTPPMIFYLEAQDIVPRPQTFGVRTVGNPTAMFPSIREAIRQVDPSLPLQNVTTQQETEADLLRAERTFASTATVFGGMAVMVSALGLFGLLSYAVSRRTREIGVRMALGAERHAIRRAILRESIQLVGAGVVLGLFAVSVATRFIGSVLFGVSPYDPATLISAVIVMVTVSAVATTVPTRRATRIDPMAVLRAE